MKLLIPSFILHSIHEMSLFLSSTHVNGWEETKREGKVLMSKVKISEEVP